MEQIYASIVNYFYSLNKVNLIYDNEMEQGMTVPCMFFPQPEIIPFSESLSSFKLTKTIFIKIIENNTEVAVKKGINIVEEIVKNKYKIPLIDKTGHFIEENLKIKTILLSKIDEGVCQIKIIWDENKLYNNEQFEPIVNFDITSKAKGDDNNEDKK